MPYVRVATVQELTPNQGKLVEASGKQIALFLVDGKYYAIDNTCPHRGAPLAEGVCVGAEVVCPWHSARFDLATGTHLCPPAKSGVTAYPVRVEGEEIQIDVP